MDTVAAEIPVQTRRDPSLLQMAHPVEAALLITVSVWRDRAKWPGRSRNMPGLLPDPPSDQLNASLVECLERLLYASLV